jgi:hypothetical protein
LSAVDENFFTQRPTTPTGLVNFGRIQNLPLILGLVLAVMALLTVAHLLATSIRRRRRRPWRWYADPPRHRCCARSDL